MPLVGHVFLLCIFVMDTLSIKLKKNKVKMKDHIKCCSIVSKNRFFRKCIVKCISYNIFILSSIMGGGHRDNL